MIFLELLLLLVLLANTALLVAVAGSLQKILNRQAEAVAAAAVKRVKPVVSDQPVPRQPNYGDIVAMRPPSTDLKLIKDI